jgi:hypothetical protein
MSGAVGLIWLVCLIARPRQTLEWTLLLVVLGFIVWLALMAAYAPH